MEVVGKVEPALEDGQKEICVNYTVAKLLCF
jgi:hypothetical protein